jgi:flagellar assembly protein FliH
VTSPPRRPSFLARLPDERSARPARFGVAATPHLPIPGRGGEPLPPAPPSPSPEELAERAEALARVAHAVEILKLQSARLAEQARSDALEIGFEVARRILEAELHADPGVMINLVRTAVERAGASRSISVRVHPEDLAAVTSAAEAGELGVGVAKIEVVPDPNLAPGDVLVDTDFGRVDGRLRTRLDELQRAARAAAEEGAA